MKRYSGLYDQIISIENLKIADEKARRGKLKQRSVIKHDHKRDVNIESLHQTLKEVKFKTSTYTTFKISDPKERIIYRLPYFPDRIVHHAIINVIQPIFMETFTSDTYSCIKGRGIHSASTRLKAVLRKGLNTEYCLKIDVKQFYPSINHDILKQLVRKKFKDARLLVLMDEIIDSAPGLPIGNFLSQYLANFYLTYFDHWIKEKKQVPHYFRYADDMIFLSDDKAFLQSLFHEIKDYLRINLDLEVKQNYQVFPVSSRGIDFIGYNFYNTHTRIRKNIKQKLARKIKKGINTQSKASYFGWLKHANCINLTNKLTKNYAA